MTSTTTTTSCPHCGHHTITTPQGRHLEVEPSLGTTLPDGTRLTVEQVYAGIRGHHFHTCPKPQYVQEALV